MAYAAYCDSFGLTLASPAPREGPRWVVMDVTVHSGDALHVRRALAHCAGAGILRCIPRLEERQVRLEIRMSAHRAADVMGCVMASVPGGVIGPLISWRRHLQRHGLGHGL